ncbi:MAG: DUF1963 domain-containing protein [Anaeromicrobium sp.]|uniref:YwqG family protein n=1 Tax=Anaeromicrobium sp. TaxID=1929132 RepID=UPI0025F12678|nr:DUF1963 domain-containing protein [Anaeromicrobium sp.]MCT4595646.1 DUF1963 domain-containing protein [Anaeromicrobium sp.]
MLKYEVSELFREYEKIIKTSIRKSNEITFTKEDTKPWESKLGGCPYLENIEDYPLGKNNKPMIFLAQINLADLVELKNMPENGLLQFYIHNDECYGYEGPCKVKYIEKYITDVNQLVCKNPYEEDYKEFLPFDKEGKMNFQLREMPISCSCEKFNELFKGISFNEEQKEKIWHEFDGSGSRFGGYPYFIQSEPAYCDEYNILLLQLDVEDECGIMFGDTGNCNFFIKEEDLKNRDFSNVAYDWQCC